MSDIAKVSDIANVMSDIAKVSDITNLMSDIAKVSDIANVMSDITNLPRSTKAEKQEARSEEGRKTAVGSQFQFW